jgi:formylglycine-generating enzyme required for sulfatase activity
LYKRITASTTGRNSSGVAWQALLQKYPQAAGTAEGDVVAFGQKIGVITLAMQSIIDQRVADERERQQLDMIRQLTDPITGMEFVAVKGGCFQMGDTIGDGFDDEKPVHEVCVSDFSIGKYEVTQGQWIKVMGNNPSSFISCGDSCPVENVSWNDVQEYISKLNRQSGRTYRLPTEAEWEYAARSGGKHEKYSGGDTLDAVAWYDGNSGGKTHPVGQKAANSLGIHDMSGNVCEWTGDWYGSYGSSWQQRTQRPSTGSGRVFRGGDWNDVPKAVRATYRYDRDPGKRSSYIGFRLVSPVQPMQSR